jgi:hypothetical protein
MFNMSRILLINNELYVSYDGGYPALTLLPRKVMQAIARNTDSFWYPFELETLWDHAIQHVPTYYHGVIPIKHLAEFALFHMVCYLFGN